MKIMQNIKNPSSTELDTEVSSVLERAKRPELILIIGNKNYSSWSMRPWVVLTAFDIPFKEVRILLDQPDTTNRIGEYSMAGRVPVLIDGDLTVWDSLAICEYLSEQFNDRKLWPQNAAARASARSICAEMHSSFTALRTSMPMDIRANFPGVGRTPQTQADIGRISEIWEECLSKYGHHQFLFGEFSIADAYYAPVVMRFRTYGVFLAPALQAYMERVIAHPAVANWIKDAKAETEFLPDHK
jgi:glutathione S-transferase